MRKTIFETTRIAPDDRMPRWSQALSGLCGPMKVAGYGASASIDGRIEIRTLTKLKLSRIVASAHHLSSITDVHSGGSHAAVKVILQLRGACVFEQGGVRVRVNAGECLVYDVSRPHTISSPCASEHFVVIEARPIPRSEFRPNYRRDRARQRLLAFRRKNGETQQGSILGQSGVVIATVLLSAVT